MSSQKRIEKHLVYLNKGLLSLLIVGCLFAASCNQPVTKNETSDSPASTKNKEEKNAEQASMGYGSAPNTEKKEGVIDLAVEKEAILKLHEDQRQAYLQKNPSLMVDHFADDLIMVKKGKVVKPSIANMKGQLQTIFEGVDYKKWDDVEPPVVKISDDGTMAYVIAEKEELRVVKKTNKKEIANRSLVYVYKKHHGVWKVDCIASTKVEPKKSI